MEKGKALKGKDYQRLISDLMLSESRNHLIAQLNEFENDNMKINPSFYEELYHATKERIRFYEKPYYDATSKMTFEQLRQSDNHIRSLDIIKFEIEKRIKEREPAEGEEQKLKSKKVKKGGYPSQMVIALFCQWTGIEILEIETAHEIAKSYNHKTGRQLWTHYHNAKTQGARQKLKIIKKSLIKDYRQAIKLMEDNYPNEKEDAEKELNSLLDVVYGKDRKK